MSSGDIKSSGPRLIGSQSSLVDVDPGPVIRSRPSSDCDCVVNWAMV